MKRITKLAHLLDLYTTIDRLGYANARLWAWRVTDTGKR